MNRGAGGDRLTIGQPLLMGVLPGSYPAFDPGLRIVPRRSGVAQLQHQEPCRLLGPLALVGNLPDDGLGLLLPRHAGFSENRKTVMAITAIGRERI